MDDGTLRELPEIALFLELNEDYREVIVEGSSDASLIGHFLQEKGIDVTVFAVDERVNIGSAHVTELGENVGARGRVVACASYLAKCAASNRVTCIIDADFHYLTPDQVGELECLLRTDYGALELYGFNEATLQRLFRVGLRASKDFDASTVVDALYSSLVDLFICRSVLHAFPTPPALLPPTKKNRVLISSGQVQVDIDKLLKDTLNSSRDPAVRALKSSDVVGQVRQIRAKLSPDWRKFMNGHDCIELLAWYIGKVWPALVRDDRVDMRKANNLAIALRLSLAVGELESETMFKTLMRRVSDQAA